MYHASYKTSLFAAALLGSVAFASQAGANSVAILTGDATITVVDPSGKMAAKTWNVSGVTGKLAGIDVRPADGMLYGLLEDGTVVTIDTASGKATVKSKLDVMLPKGTMATVDFNPVADRLRVIGSDGMNLRANVDDGKVTTDKPLNFAETDAMKGKAPKVVAGAYVNSMKGAKETTLYNIDSTDWTLVKQAPPNDGVLTTIGKLGLTEKATAFDIASDGKGGNEAWLISGNALYKVDLTTAKATSAGALTGVNGTIRDMAVLPAM
ncbi:MULTISPECIES: DUF4394 domain-containing protein [unclassified Beijerinckia]|uniref:DUF4394 domain-containing protein n=1 Tax=unclassified Beijerinckia TaxID=2638183 RepID=UPI00089AEE65|nr:MULTISPECIES: DUF4394 domain-containing protein [unclassified Beijerinckia]MDH7799784.1 hypothetical protein [Beijerinckia sp. GAS462]SED37318.1 protein of unknown function [Beijerinckia sp. 28-YEA-48]